MVALDETRALVVATEGYGDKLGFFDPISLDASRREEQRASIFRTVLEFGKRGRIRSTMIRS